MAERIKLTFVPETERGRGWVGVEGDTEAEVLDAWNALPAWSIYDPADFR